MKINWHLFWQQHCHQLISGVLMWGSGLFLGGGGARVGYRPTGGNSSSCGHAFYCPDGKGSYSGPGNASYACPDGAGLLPDALNLCQIYDGEGPGALNLAQKLYDVLAVREAEWLSQIYALYGKTPGELAGEGRMPAGRIPESLKEFKGVQITFTNGDGTVIWDSSNVKAIMAMTSVYHYYGQLQTWDEIQSYALGLWEASHSCTYTVSPIYYCEGCIETAKEEATVSNAQENALTATRSGALKVKEDGTLDPGRRGWRSGNRPGDL